MKLMPKTLILAAAVAITGCDGCSGSKDGSNTQKNGQASTEVGDTSNSKEGDLTKLEVIDIEVGDGKEATSGTRVTVHYTGTLENGTKFDSSVDRGQPFNFNLGRGEVIKGWDEGVAGMKIGGKRKLIIPSHMGYGKSGVAGVIPPNATLVFEVELLEVN
jgi:FKBP-type peptidyl-prolyl cis-trans isomerase